MAFKKNDIVFLRSPLFERCPATKRRNIVFNAMEKLFVVQDRINSVEVTNGYENRSIPPHLLTRLHR